jgi:hypothetical protein
VPHRFFGFSVEHMSVVRRPGGDLVFNDVWQIGVGPRAQWTAPLDRAWRSPEPNAVGTDNFLQRCKRIGVEPRITVNRSMWGLIEAVDRLQYGDAVFRSGDQQCLGRRGRFGAGRCDARGGLRRHRRLAVNRSLSEPVEHTLDLRLVAGLALSQHLYLSGDDPFPTNSATEADRSLRGSAPSHFDLTPTMQLPPISRPCIRLSEGNSA